MRRTVLALLAAALVLAGCSSSSTEVGGGSSADGSAAGPDDADFPVTIAHRFGSTTIEQAPERVVTVGLTDQDALLALGVVPVATTMWFGEHPGNIFPWATDALGDGPVPEVLESEKEFEPVAALQPDLILAIYSGISQHGLRPVLRDSTRGRRTEGLRRLRHALAGGHHPDRAGGRSAGPGRAAGHRRRGADRRRPAGAPGVRGRWRR